MTHTFFTRTVTLAKGLSFFKKTKTSMWATKFTDLSPKFVQYINIYPISYIQFGNPPTRDSHHPTPPHAWAAADGVGGGG